MTMKPSSPRKRRKNPPVSKPETLATESKKQLEEPARMKYSRRDKVGTPTIGRSPNYVTTVGLGNLKVITTDGYTDV